MAKTLPVSGCPEDFTLTEKTVSRIERDYPDIDIPKTLRKFVLNAEAKGWMYRNWQMAFVNYCDNGNQYGGITYKQGLSADPQWKPILAEVAPYGFRAPLPHETPASYRTDFELWKGKQKRSAPVIDFGDALKKMG